MTERKDVLVLAVDANPSLQKIISRHLHDGGYNAVLLAGSIPEAWNILTQKDIGLVICDLVVGQHSGVALLQRIRQSPKIGKLPVVVMSAKKDKRIVTAAARAGASAFLVKPFSQDTLLATVEKAISHSAKKAQAPAPTSQDAQKVLDAGFKALDERDPDKAIAYFSKAVKASPKSADAFRGLAYACKAKKQDDKFAQFLLTAGKVHVENGEFSEAEKLFLEHRRHDAGAPSPFAECARALAEKEDYEPAARLYERALILDPDNTELLIGSAEALSHVGKGDTAKERLELALAANDDAPQARKLWKNLTGKSWSQTTKERAKAEADGADRREAVRFWVPDLLLELSGYEDHFAITELSMGSVAFSPQEQTFTIDASIPAKILHLTENGVTPELKHLTLTVARVEEEKIGCLLGELTPEQESRLGEILEAAQERQIENKQKEKTDIGFDIDMLFM